MVWFSVIDSEKEYLQIKQGFHEDFVHFYTITKIYIFISFLFHISLFCYYNVLSQSITFKFCE